MIQRIKGTMDILPTETPLFRYIVLSLIEYLIVKPRPQTLLEESQIALVIVVEVSLRQLMDIIGNSSPNDAFAATGQSATFSI